MLGSGLFPRFVSVARIVTGSPGVAMVGVTRVRASSRGFWVVLRSLDVAAGVEMPVRMAARMSAVSARCVCLLMGFRRVVPRRVGRFGVRWGT